MMDTVESPCVSERAFAAEPKGRYGKRWLKRYFIKK